MKPQIDPITGQVTLASPPQIHRHVSGGGGGGTWGSITGDINDQTDLIDLIGDVQENIEYTEYTYNSSGIKKGSRHNDWTELMAAVVAQGTPCRITFEQDETLPAGTWKIKDVVWRGNGLPAGLGGPLIYLSEGFYFADTISITFEYGLGVVNTASHHNLSVNHSLRVNMTTSAIASASGVEMFEITGSGSLGIMFVGDGASLSSFGMGPAVKYGAGTVGPVVFSGVNPDMMSDTISGHSTALILYIFATQTFATDIFAVTQPNFAGTIQYGRSDSRYVGFNPAGTNLTQPSVQGAIAEVSGKVDSLETEVDSLIPQAFVDSEDIVWDRTVKDISVSETQGRTSVGGSSQSGGSSRKAAYLLTTTKGIWAHDIKFRARVNGGTSKVKGMIYANNSGAPSTLLAVGSEVTVTNTSMNVYTSSLSSDIFFPAGTSIWLGILFDGNGSGFVFSCDSTTNGRIRTSSGLTYASEPTNPFLASYNTENGSPDVWLDGYGTAMAAKYVGDPYILGDGLEKVPQFSGDPATTGNLANNGTASSSSDRQFGSVFTMPEDGQLDYVKFVVGLSTSGSMDTQALVYDVTSSLPVNLLAEGSSVNITNTTPTAIQYDFTGGDRIIFSESDELFFAVRCSNETPNFVWSRSDNVSNALVVSNNNAFSNPPLDPFGTPGYTSNGNISIEIGYTTSENVLKVISAPDTGTFTLKSIDGDIQWVED